MKEIKKDIDNIFDKVHDEEIKLPASVILTIAELPSKKIKREQKIMETKTQKAPSLWRTKWMRFAAISMSFLLVIGGVIGGYFGLRGGSENNIKNLSVYYNTLQNYNEIISSDKNLSNFVEKLAEYNFSLNGKTASKYKNQPNESFEDPDKGPSLTDSGIPEFTEYSFDSTLFVAQEISYETFYENGLRYDHYREYGDNNETVYSRTFNLDGTPKESYWTKNIYYGSGTVNRFLSDFTTFLNPAYYNVTTQSSTKMVYTSKDGLMANEIVPIADSDLVSIIIEIDNEDELKLECVVTSSNYETTSNIKLKLGETNVVIPQEALDSLCMPQNLVFDDENKMLSWDAVTDANGYALSIKGMLPDTYISCVSQGIPFDFDVCSDKQTSNTYFDINELFQEEPWSSLDLEELGVYIVVSVAAQNAKGESFAKNDAVPMFFYIVTQQEVEPDLLSAPQNLAFNDENKILSWDVVPDAYGYFLHAKGTPQGYTLAANREINDAYFDMNELFQDWAEYGSFSIEVSVAALNIEGRWSDMATITIYYDA